MTTSMKNIHVNDIISSSLTVFWSANIGKSVNFSRLPEKARKPMTNLIRGLKGWFLKTRCTYRGLSFIVPWLNAAVIYGNSEQRMFLGEAHEVYGHYELNNKMPSEKINCINIHTALIRLNEDPEKHSNTLYSAFLFNETSAPIKEFYATELIEKSLAESWIKSNHKDFREEGLKRFEELKCLEEIKSVKDIPEENWMMYRYVVARQIRDALKSVNTQPEELFEMMTKLHGSGINLSPIFIAPLIGSFSDKSKRRALREKTALYPDGLKAQWSLEELYTRKTLVLRKPLLRGNPWEEFWKLCKAHTKEYKEPEIRLLYRIPFNRIFTESLILIREKGKDIFIELRVPEELYWCVEASSNLVAALINAKVMLFKLLQATTSVELYTVNLNNVISAKVNDITIEQPIIEFSSETTKVIRELVEDTIFKDAVNNVREYIVKAAEEIKITI